ncbi:hypothetical protein CEXT_807161 [Caerostris extrusa]|uniref:Uncharacterized protein n=1 Tax=Caerostris extrusa TaxID=172846 RepID=A0AAV4S1H4_CAEEX|nr:hypothetical protein CEXT_807161 [Caerostris extrusa]
MLQLPQLLSSLLSNHNRHDFSSLQHLKSIARWKTHQSFGELACLSHQHFSLGAGDRFIWSDSFFFPVVTFGFQCLLEVHNST